MKKYGVECYLNLNYSGDKIKGSNSPVWKGDNYDRNLRSTDQYCQWRKSIFTRDNYICQKCGQHGDINAHHIYNWADYLNLRFEIGNGITLCTSCHKEFHSIYGKHFTNKEQLMIFMKHGKKLC